MRIRIMLSLILFFLPVSVSAASVNCRNQLMDFANHMMEHHRNRANVIDYDIAVVGATPTRTSVQHSEGLIFNMNGTFEARNKMTSSQADYFSRQIGKMSIQITAQGKLLVGSGVLKELDDMYCLNSAHGNKSKPGLLITGKVQSGWDTLFYQIILAKGHLFKTDDGNIPTGVLIRD